MNVSPKIVIFADPAAAAEELAARLNSRGYQTLVVADREFDRGAQPCLGGDLAIVLLNRDHSPRGLPALLRQLLDRQAATILCGLDQPVPLSPNPLLEQLPPGASVDEIVGKVGTLARYVPLLRGFERELRHLQRLGEQLNRYFGEIDQEMRLAGRLQRDFLPREMPRIDPFRFDAVYRPASWVSGDLYDVFTIDATHVGVFIADAMGHGVAAGLLTMFLRQALIPKQTHESREAILSPARSLTELHASLVRQRLPHSQFVTAAYGVLDTSCGLMKLARAGHPYPLLVNVDKAVREVQSSGGLLGIPDMPPDFEEVTVRLEPGAKLLFYTDGMEDVLLAPPSLRDTGTQFTAELCAWAGLGVDELIRTVNEHLDGRAGSLNPPDDATLLAMEVIRQP